MQENMFDSCMHSFLGAQMWGGGTPDSLAWEVGRHTARTRSQGWSSWASSNYLKHMAPNIPNIYIYILIYIYS
jgi:hypothetical protein